MEESIVSSSSDSISETASTSIASKNTRGISATETWKYARPPYENEKKEQKGNQLWYCLPCSSASASPSSIYSTYVTTNLRRHLKSKHGIDISPQPGAVGGELDQEFSRVWSKIKQENRTEEFAKCILQDVLSKDDINEALTSLITVRNLPSRLVEWPEFHSFCSFLNPEAKSILSTAHSTIPKLIQSSFEISKDIVRKKLQSAISRVHLSLDIWTSPNQHLFLAIVGHFLDIDPKRQDALLALRTVSNHGGKEQGNIVFSVLQEYNIVRHLGIIMGDNASNNNTLCRAISTHLKEEGITWDAKQERLRCLGHIINLVVQALLFHDQFGIEELSTHDKEEAELSADASERQAKAKSFRKLGPLGKLHNIVVHIRSSPHRTKKFVSLAGRKIPLDNRTRWNSWYQMLLAATKNEAAVDTYTKSYLDDLSKEYLSPQDWESLPTTRNFLQPFHQATLAAEGKNGTLDKVFFTMDILFQFFKMEKVFYFKKKFYLNIIIFLLIFF